MMSVSEKIKHITLFTKRLMRLNLLGHSRSLVKGSGLEFDQLRDYQIGDDVRAIDWNSSARMNKLLVKQFNDERHRTLIIALDISASSFYGSQDVLKQTILSQIAALISYAGFLGKDEVGLILFSDQVECYIPMRKGKAHIQLILEKIFSAQKKNCATSLACALDHIIKLRKKNAMVFLISDFIDEGFDQKLSLCAQLCDVIAIRMLDAAERNFPADGLITVKDSESDQINVISSRSMSAVLQQRADYQKKILNSYRVDVLDVSYTVQPLEQLIHFFRIRDR